MRPYFITNYYDIIAHFLYHPIIELDLVSHVLNFKQAVAKWNLMNSKTAIENIHIN